jgi:hypothetical protein
MNAYSQMPGSPRTNQAPIVYRDRPVFETTEIGDVFPASGDEIEGFFDPDPISKSGGGSSHPASYEDIAGQSPYFDLELS